MPDFDDPDGWVTIRHPEVGVSPNKVHQSAFDSTWSALGWEIVSDDVAAAVAPDGDLSKLSTTALREVAAGRGVGVEGITKKADLVAAIEAGGGS